MQVTMNGAAEPKSHFVLVPLMAPGHTIPMTDLARLLAERGAIVTLITTPSNASRIKTTIDRVQDSGLPIRFVSMRFPCAEVGLPEGCENIDALATQERGIKFFEACCLLKQPLETYLREHEPYPSCIISDSCFPWTWDVARKLEIPRLTYFGICCFTLLCEHNIARYRVYDTITDETEPFLVPGLVHNIEVTKAQAPGFFADPVWEKLRDDIREADGASEGVVVNSFDELEPLYVESYQKTMGKKVWTLGPFSLHNKVVADVAARGNKASIDSDRCLRWLDSMQPGSVVYVSFGSLSYTHPAQLIEIGLGLESSNQPFVWVIKKTESSPKIEQWLAEGFEDRTRTRGLIIKGWAPQLIILSHPAVGAFMTHCGWNSSIEGISAGVPLITWPFFADQFLNERLLVDVLRVGVTVGVKMPSSWGAANDQVLAKRDDVAKAVHSLMDGGEEGKEIRERARAFGRKARKAMEEGGSSHANTTQLITYISPDPSKNLKDGKMG